MFKELVYWLLLVTLLCSCASQPQLEVDTSKKIQIVKLNEKYNLFVQKDEVLQHDKLSEGLIKFKPDFKTEVSAADSKNTWANILSLTGLLTVVTAIPVAANNRDNTWLYLDIGGLLLIFWGKHLFQSANGNYTEVVKKYNEGH